ncbi:MAG: TIGR03013 family XrtA/PEP-CTERM system glycosyltransferase [bacterium]
MLKYLEKPSLKLSFLLFLVDALILLSIGVFFFEISERIFFNTVDLEEFYLTSPFLVILILTSMIIFFINQFFKIDKREQKKLLIFRCIFSFVIVSVILYILFREIFPYYWCLFSSMLACIFILFWRRIFYYCFISKIDLQQKILFFGTDELSKRVVREILSDNRRKFKVVGFIGNDPSLLGKSIVNPKVIGLAEDLESIIEKEKVKKVIVFCPQARGELPANNLVRCKFKGTEVLDLHTFYEHFRGKILLDGLRPSWLIFAQGFKKTRLIKLGKRIFDMLLSIIGLILSLPISIFTALIIKLESKGPIIFKQERIGENGRVFNLIKFRSMKIDAEKYTGPVWAEENDPRITRVGKIIRRLHIDEIPQMINVLKGDMSFVGPRPERPYFVKKLAPQIPYYDQRHSVKPGITGWAAVNYKYGANLVDAVEKLQYDLYYIKNISLFLDIIIILRTIFIVLSRKGAR